MYYIILFTHETFGYHDEESTFDFTVSNLFKTRKEAVDFLLGDGMKQKEDFYYKHTSLDNYTKARIEPVLVE